jgi:hypothetical protein
MPAPSLCGTFLQNKRALIAFTWTLTTILTLVAFVLTLVYVGHVHTRYMRLEHYYYEQYQYSQQNNNNDDKNQNNNNHGNSQDEREYKERMQLAHVASKSMTFVSLYTMTMSVALVMYGSTAIVGFTSLRGVYIAPCFSNPGNSSKLKVGIFGGAIIIFANLLLVCAVIFGEVRVEKNNDNHKDDKEQYEVERIATILAVCCMFLSALYTIFAILLYLFYVSDENGLEDDDDVITKSLPPLSSDSRRENFITIGERLQVS